MVGCQGLSFLFLQSHGTQKSLDTRARHSETISATKTGAPDVNTEAQDMEELPFKRCWHFRMQQRETAKIVPSFGSLWNVDSQPLHVYLIRGCPTGCGCGDSLIGLLHRETAPGSVAPFLFQKCLTVLKKENRGVIVTNFRTV